MISTLDIAWAAGFIEGDGWFLKTPTGSPSCGAAQVQKEPLERLQRIFGGKLVQRKTKGFSDKPIWFWSVPARRSMEVMMTLYVLMSPKRKSEIERALAMWSKTRNLRSHGSDTCTRQHNLSDPANVYLYKGRKICKTCMLAAKRARRARMAAAV